MIYPLKNQCNEEEPKPSQEENRKTEKPICLLYTSAGGDNQNYII